MAAVKKVAACTEMLKKHLRLALFSGAGGTGFMQRFTDLVS